MTNVVKKVSINGQVVPFGGGGGSGEANETVYLTQAEYDVLTPDEHTDYVIYDTSTSPVGIDAESVSFDNTQTTMQSDNVQDAIEEVFQSVSNGKDLIADAITDKGVSTSASDSFQTMATNIGLIESRTEADEVMSSFYSSTNWSFYWFVYDNSGSWAEDASVVMWYYNNEDEIYFCWLWLNTIWAWSTWFFSFYKNWEVKNLSTNYWTLWYIYTGTSQINKYDPTTWYIYIWCDWWSFTNATPRAYYVYDFETNTILEKINPESLPSWVVDMQAWLWYADYSNNWVHPDWFKYVWKKDRITYNSRVWSIGIVEVP